MTTRLNSSLSEFSTGQLRQELDARHDIEQDDRRDKSRRQFFRELTQKFATIKDQARFIADEDREVLNDFGKLYVFDFETDEEVATRLSRKAIVRWEHDNWRMSCSESGAEVADVGLYSNTDAYKNGWESKDEWTKDFAMECLGYSSWHPALYRM